LKIGPRVEKLHPVDKYKCKRNLNKYFFALLENFT
jgi:hypothetical protein